MKITDIRNTKPLGPVVRELNSSDLDAMIAEGTLNRAA